VANPEPRTEGVGDSRVGMRQREQRSWLQDSLQGEQRATYAVPSQPAPPGRAVLVVRPAQPVALPWEVGRVGAGASGASDIYIE